MTCFLQKLHSGWESNVNEVNLIFFQRQQAHMPYMTCFFRKLHDMWEANVNKVNAIFFCRHSKPTWRVGVKHKWGESNIYLWAKRAKPSIWPFLWKLGDMLELNVHKVDSFFCKHSEPVLPYYLFLNNFFARAASPPPGFLKIVWRVTFKC